MAWHGGPGPGMARRGLAGRGRERFTKCRRQPSAVRSHRTTGPTRLKRTRRRTILTAYCRYCHDLFTEYIWFISFGGSRELLRELFPALLARVLECPERLEHRRVGRARLGRRGQRRAEASPTSAGSLTGVATDREGPSGHSLAAGRSRRREAQDRVDGGARAVLLTGKALYRASTMWMWAVTQSASCWVAVASA